MAMRHLPTQLQAPFHPLAYLIGLPVLCAGCTVEGSYEKSTQPVLQVVYEVERNDEAWEANDLGWLKPGQELELRGTISDDGWDPYDGFALRAEADLRIRWELVPLDTGYGPVDLDLHLYDPALQDFIASFDCGCATERGTIELPAGTEVHLVIAAWTGKSRWALRMVTEPVQWLTPPSGVLVDAQAVNARQVNLQGYARTEPLPQWQAEWQAALRRLQQAGRTFLAR